MRVFVLQYRGLRRRRRQGRCHCAVGLRLRPVEEARAERRRRRVGEEAAGEFFCVRIV